MSALELADLELELADSKADSSIDSSTIGVWVWALNQDSKKLYIIRSYRVLHGYRNLTYFLVEVKSFYFYFGVPVSWIEVRCKNFVNKSKLHVATAFSFSLL